MHCLIESEKWARFTAGVAITFVLIWVMICTVIKVDVRPQRISENSQGKVAKRNKKGEPQEEAHRRDYPTAQTAGKTCFVSVYVMRGLSGY